MTACTQVEVPASVTFADAPAVLETLAAQTGGGAFTANLGACAAFDSSLIGVLLDLLRRAGPAASECRFVHSDPKLRKLAALYGVDALLFERGPDEVPAP